MKVNNELVLQIAIQISSQVWKAAHEKAVMGVHLRISLVGNGDRDPRLTQGK